MERSIISARVRETLVSVLGHEGFEMREDLTAPEVEGWDSLTHMTILSALEKNFNVKFRLKEINKLKNMGTLIDLIASKLDPA